MSRSLASFLIFLVALAGVSALGVWWLGADIASLAIDDSRRNQPYYLIHFATLDDPADPYFRPGSPPEEPDRDEEEVTLSLKQQQNRFPLRLLDLADLGLDLLGLVHLLLSHLDDDIAHADALPGGGAFGIDLDDDDTGRILRVAAAVARAKSERSLV